MIATIIIFLFIGLIITGIFISPVLTKRRRNRLKHRPFPSLWNSNTRE